MGILRSTRRSSYRLGRILGDVNALTSLDPTKVAKRVIRKKVTARTLGALVRLFNRG